VRVSANSSATLVGAEIYLTDRISQTRSRYVAFMAVTGFPALNQSWRPGRESNP
jgi:hypothetical protein